MSAFEQVQRTLEKLAAQSCGRVFDAYGVSLASPEDPQVAPLFEFYGCVSVAGHALCGTLILAATAEPLHRADPLRRPQTTRDWVGELANQVAGNIKNLLLGYGVEILINVPTVVRTSSAPAIPQGGVPPVSFVSDPGRVCMWIDIEPVGDIQLPEQPEPERAGVQAGELLMFLD